jgi:hypothetical protein
MPKMQQERFTLRSVPKGCPILLPTTVMQIAVGFTMTSHTYFTTGYLNTEFKLRPLQYTTQVRFVNPGKAKNTILSPVKYSFKLTIHSS